MSVGEQTVAKVPFVFAVEKFFNPRKFDSQAEIGGPETVVESTGENNY